MTNFLFSQFSQKIFVKFDSFPHQSTKYLFPINTLQQIEKICLFSFVFRTLVLQLSCSVGYTVDSVL